MSGSRLVAVCADNPLPSEGSGFSACADVVWVREEATQLSQEDIQTLFPAILGFFAICFVWRLLRKVF